MTEDEPTRGRRARWSDTFGAGLKRVRALTTGLSREQLNFEPSPDRWSVGQCIDHLSVSMDVYLQEMEPAVERSDRKGGEPYGRGTWMGRFLVRALRKPGKRYPAPRSFRPASGTLDPNRVQQEFENQVSRMRRTLARSRGLALGRIKVPWPVFGLIKISLAQAFELQALHLDRHLDQAERLTRTDEFPA
ncbi:MAG: DinB family protein [Thermoanaerobaculia bacterium]|nr:DinB family protein [Thermoanaerobaculia bacterium]